MPIDQHAGELMDVRFLEIQRIRAAAIATPGEAFDDVGAGTGPLPVGVLDEVVQAWAGRQR